MLTFLVAEPEDLGAGPLLGDVLAAQLADERATSYPCLVEHAQAVISLAERLGDPILWPVGEAAERLMGAVELLGEGHARARGWSATFNHESVLVVVLNSVSPLPVLAAASQVRRLGASTVYACGLDVRGMPDVGTGVEIDGFWSLCGDRMAGLTA